jgi:hypothetical protein
VAVTENVLVGEPVKVESAEKGLVGEPIKVEGLPTAVDEQPGYPGLLPPTPWERMKQVKAMKQDGSDAEHLAKVRTIMVGNRGPPIDEEVGYQPCFCCLCFLCCDPGRPLVDKCKKTPFKDERIDRPWNEILADVSNCETAFWFLVCLTVFAAWGYVSTITMPGKMLTLLEGQIQTYWSMIYLDLFPNVLTAYVYHQYTCCHRLHKAEHRYIFQSKGIVAQFSVGSAYFFYFNCWTAPIYVITVLPALVTDRVDTHWECAIFQATWIQTVILFCIRILMWVMEQRPSMYSYAPTCWLNFLRFFKTHFTMAAFEYYESGRYKGRTLSTGYGNVMPFFDVVIGSCPFNVRYSVPFPFIDYITHGSKTWCEYVDPADITWTPVQRIWYAFWFLFLIAITVLNFAVYWAPWGSCYPWEVSADQWKFP